MALLLITSPAARAATPSPSPSPQPAPATAASPAPDPTPQATMERSPSSASSNTSAPPTQAPVISSPAPSASVSAPVTPVQSAVPNVSAPTSTAPRVPSDVNSVSTHTVAPVQLAAPAVSHPGRAPARPKAPRLDAKRVSASSLGDSRASTRRGLGRKSDPADHRLRPSQRPVATAERPRSGGTGRCRSQAARGAEALERAVVRRIGSMKGRWRLEVVGVLVAVGVWLGSRRWLGGITSITPTCNVQASATTTATVSHGLLVYEPGGP